MAIIPLSTEILPDGRPKFTLAPADHEKVRQGYGCPNCLEDFTEFGANGVTVVFGKCPVCKHVIDPHRDFLPAEAPYRPFSPDDPFYG